MNESDRTVHVGNYKVPKWQLAKSLQEKFGACFVRDPLAPRTEGNAPYGFAIFEREEDAQKCLAAKRLHLNGETLTFSPASRKSNRGPGSRPSGDSLSFTSVKSDSFTSEMDYMSLPSGGQLRVKGQPSAVHRFRSIMSFYKSLDELYIQDVSGTKAAEYFRLQDQLQDHCLNAARVANPDSDKLYGGLFTEDSHWYRCHVLTSNGDKYKVQFVDYGNKSEVSKENVRELDDRMTSVPAAARKCHIKDLVPRPNCSDKVDQLMATWLETIVECEYSPDHSVDLFNNETGTSLRAALINSKIVTMSSPVDGSSDLKSDMNKRKTLCTQSLLNGTAECEHRKQVETLTSEKEELRKELLEKGERIEDLTAIKSIDSLNVELNQKLMAVRSMRPKCPLSLEGVLGEAVSVLASNSFTRDAHDAILEPVSALYSQYCSEQEQLQQLQPAADSLDPTLIAKRNDSRKAFCDAVKVAQCSCSELKVSERRTRLSDIRAKLPELSPSIGDEHFDGDIGEMVAKFNEWLEEEGKTIRQVQQNSEDALASLQHVMARQSLFLKQSLDLEADVEEPTELSVIAPTQLAIERLDQELKVIDGKQGNPLFNVVHSLCAVLRDKIGEELNLLDDMNKTLSRLQELSSTLEPWFGVSEPERLDWMQAKEKKLKELRSQLRHRLADLDDLKENEESDSEVADMERKVDGLRNEIHCVLVELEEYVEQLAQLTDTVFPEFALQYPKLGLRKVKDDKRCCIKPMRDFNFYEDNGTTRSTFNGEQVIVKAFNAPTGRTNYIPSLVDQLLATEVNRHIQLQAVFFSKNGTTTYMQLRSDNADIMDYLANTSVIEFEPLKLFLSRLTSSTAPSTASTQDGDSASGGSDSAAFDSDSNSSA